MLTVTLSLHGVHCPRETMLCMRWFNLKLVIMHCIGKTPTKQLLSCKQKKQTKKSMSLRNVISRSNNMFLLTNANKADLSFCLADFLNAKIIFGDTAVSGALVTPVTSNT